MWEKTFWICSGEADEEAFAEECRRRGQHALPSQPTNLRLLKPHKSASSPRFACHYSTDEVEEQDKSRVTSSFEAPFYLSGYKEGSKRRKQKQREELKKKKATKASY
ncbi:dnaJ homolog subfamily B member 6-like [Acridotheres tristis]